MNWQWRWDLLNRIWLWYLNRNLIYWSGRLLDGTINIFRSRLRFRGSRRCYWFFDEELAIANSVVDWLTVGVGCWKGVGGVGRWFAEGCRKLFHFAVWLKR